MIYHILYFKRVYGMGDYFVACLRTVLPIHIGHIAEGTGTQVIHQIVQSRIIDGHETNNPRSSASRRGPQPWQARRVATSPLRPVTTLAPGGAATSMSEELHI